jgi:hypothetical protein
MESRILAALLLLCYITIGRHADQMSMQPTQYLQNLEQRYEKLDKSEVAPLFQIKCIMLLIFSSSSSSPGKPYWHKSVRLIGFRPNDQGNMQLNRFWTYIVRINLSSSSLFFFSFMDSFLSFLEN